MANREHIVVEYRNGRKTVSLGESAMPLGSTVQYRELEALAQELGADLKDPNGKVRDWLAMRFKSVGDKRSLLQSPFFPPPAPFSMQPYFDESMRRSREGFSLDLELDELFDIQKKLYGIDLRKPR